MKITAINEYKKSDEINGMKLCVSEEDIDDIMCAALEGGITDWCECIRIKKRIDGANFASEQIAKGGTLEFKVIESFDEKETEWYLLNKKKFLKGLSKFLKKTFGKECLYERMNKLYVDTCYIDAERADAIIQYALFGEIVYG